MQRFWHRIGLGMSVIIVTVILSVPVGAKSPHHHKPTHHPHVHVISKAKGNTAKYTAVGCFSGDNICYIAKTGHAPR